jgi:vanillate O-demethylase monooxygenase subunit
MWAEDLPSGEPRARTLLGEAMVFWRRADGTPVVMADLCPHRFAPLSMGRLLPGDRIMCPYHGLEFGPDGGCARNPHGRGTIPATARVRTWPVIEKHSLIWVWPGEASPDPAGIPDFSCFDGADPLHVTKRDHLLMRANYELITDNLLDLSHTSYLHDGILGNAEMVAAEMTVEGEGDTVIVRRESAEAPTPGLFLPLLPEPLERVSKWNAIRWSAPGCMLIDTGICRPGGERSSGTGFYGVHLLTPETARTTYYHFAAVRWGVRTEGEARNAEILEQLAKVRRFAFAEQDAPVIEAQQRALDNAGGALRPVMLSIDAGPVRYRRVLERLKKREADPIAT